MDKRELHNRKLNVERINNVSKAQLNIEVFFHQTGLNGAQPLEANELPNHFKWNGCLKNSSQIGSFPQIRTTPPSRCRITGIFFGRFPSSWNGSFDMLHFANEFHSSTHGDSNF